MQKSQTKLKIFRIVMISMWLISAAAALQNSFYWLSEWIGYFVILIVPAMLFILYYVLRIAKVLKSDNSMILFTVPSISIILFYLVLAMFDVAYGSDWIDFTGLLIAVIGISVSIILDFLVKNFEAQKNRNL